MKILYVINQGVGNVCQQIPPYLNIKHLDVDVVYLKQYPTDSVSKAQIFPAEVKEVSYSYLSKIEDGYDRIIRPPFVEDRVGGDFEYNDKVRDSFFETDNEVQRNLKILKSFDLEPLMKKEFISSPSQFEGDIVIHNGALKNWERKKYPYFPQVAQELQKGGYKVTSIGSEEEYIPGTINATGTDLRTTAGTIQNHSLYIGTDTGTYHLAALMDKPGIVIFTATDPGKNWDSEFHKTIKKIHSHLPCQPCQWGYHYSGNWRKCQDWQCQQVDPRIIIDLAERRLENG